MKVTLILARILDTFKAKNPKVFMAVVIFLAFVYAGVKELISTGIYVPPAFIVNNLEYVAMVITLLLNAGTHEVKEAAAAKEKLPEA